jgi:hypothetical protein
MGIESFSFGFANKKTWWHFPYVDKKVIGAAEMALTESSEDPRSSHNIKVGETHDENAEKLGVLSCVST